MMVLLMPLVLVLIGQFCGDVIDQRYKHHHVTTTRHLTLKMTTAQVVETSVTSNSLSQGYPHPDDHANEIIK